MRGGGTRLITTPLKRTTRRPPNRGNRTGIRAENNAMDLVDRITSVSDEDAYGTARQLGKTEGVFGGISSGANVYAALQMARELGRGRRVVTVIVDSGLRYLNGDLFR